MGTLNKLLLPPPKTFPLTTIYISKLTRALFKPITHSGEMCQWVFSTHCLETKLTPDPNIVGTICHLWAGAPWGGQDAWGVVEAIGTPCDPNYLYIPSVGIGSSASFKYTVSYHDPYTINDLYDRIRATIGLTAPGVIRWGNYWSKVINTNFTHSIDVMHFDGTAAL